MPGTRTPTNILRLRGSDKKHPDRMRARENEPEDDRPFGPPSKRLKKLELAAWKEIVDGAIPGVLTRADRIAVFLAAQLLATAWTGTATAAEVAQLARLLGQFGMNPTDRSKISVPKRQSKNPFDV